MASAVLRGFVECGALVPQRDGWRVESSAMADVGSSSHAAAFLSRRIGLLPRATVELLSAGAVLGKEFDLDFSARLAELSPAAAIAALDEARRRHLVWLRPSGAACVFVHDRVRAALLQRLTDPQRCDLHRGAARFLRETAPERIFELAYHFDAAGDSRDAFAYALAAARQARAQHSLEIAEQQYRIALRAPTTTAKCSTRSPWGWAKSSCSAAVMTTRNGSSATRRERPKEDWHARRFAANWASWPTSGATWRGRRSLLSRRCRCSAAGSPGARSALGLRLSWEILVQCLHTWLPSRFVGRRRQLPAEADLLSLRLFSRLAHGYWFVRSKARVLWAHLRGMNLAERYPPTLELAQSYSEHAPAMSLLGFFSPRNRLRRAAPSRSARRSATSGGKGSRCRITASCCMPPRVFASAWKVPGGRPTAGTHGGLLGEPHRAVPGRRLAVSPGRLGWAPSTRPSAPSVGPGVGRRTGLRHLPGRLGRAASGRAIPPDVLRSERERRRQDCARIGAGAAGRRGAFAGSRRVPAGGDDVSAGIGDRPSRPASATPT